MGKKDATERGTATIRGYVTLAEAAHHALEVARKDEIGRQYSCLHAIVCSAFAVEAYLNHIGPHKFQCWEALERLSVRSKLELLCESLHVPVDYGTRPFQSFREAFKARDMAAHGRTETKEYETRVVWGESSHEKLPVSTLDALCELAFTERVFDDVVEIITSLHKSLGEPDHDLWISFLATHTRTPDS